MAGSRLRTDSGGHRLARELLREPADRVVDARVVVVLQSATSATRDSWRASISRSAVACPASVSRRRRRVRGARARRPARAPTRRRTGGRRRSPRGRRGRRPPRACTRSHAVPGCRSTPAAATVRSMNARVRWRPTRRASSRVSSRSESPLLGEANASPTPAVLDRLAQRALLDQPRQQEGDRDDHGADQEHGRERVGERAGELGADRPGEPLDGARVDPAGADAARRECPTAPRSAGR